jgi:alcohol dehydrogenase
MKAWVMTRYGNNDVMALQDVPEPAVRPREVLIEVHAVSVNPLDFKIRSGKLRLLRPLKFPAVMGNDVAGVVKRVGAEVTRFRAGDAVFARVGKESLGTFAEFAAVEESFCARKPATLTLEQAAAVPLVALTAWQALHENLKIARGEKIFIPAGAGGVGSFAIPFAKLAGATVATTASAASRELAQRLGADIIVDYRNQRFEEVLRDFDAVFDTMGGDSLWRSFDILRPGGRICSIAGLPEPGTARQMEAGVAIKALFWLVSAKLRWRARRFGARYSYIFMRPDGEQLAAIGGLIDRGQVPVTVDKVFPFEQGKEAIAYLETGRAKGKVVIQVKA